jgi:hypothetical protein
MKLHSRFPSLNSKGLDLYVVGSGQKTGRGGPVLASQRRILSHTFGSTEDKGIVTSVG